MVKALFLIPVSGVFSVAIAVFQTESHNQLLDFQTDPLIEFPKIGKPSHQQKYQPDMEEEEKKGQVESPIESQQTSTFPFCSLLHLLNFTYLHTFEQLDHYLKAIILPLSCQCPENGNSVILI